MKLMEGAQRQLQAVRLCRMCSANFSSKLDACELVNRIPKLCRIMFHGRNGAGKNHRKVNLG